MHYPGNITAMVDALAEQLGMTELARRYASVALEVTNE